jgi:hypothetical protein
MLLTVSPLFSACLGRIHAEKAFKAYCAQRAVSQRFCPKSNSRVTSDVAPDGETVS